VIIIASSIPVIVFLSFLVDSASKSCLDYALVQLATAIVCAAVALYYSVISSKPYVALIRAYFRTSYRLATGSDAGGADRYAMASSRSDRRLAVLAGDAATRAMMCVNPFVWLTYQIGRWSRLEPSGCRQPMFLLVSPC